MHYFGLPNQRFQPTVSRVTPPAKSGNRRATRHNPIVMRTIARNHQQA